MTGTFFQPHEGLIHHPLHEREIELLVLWSGAGVVGEAFEQEADQQSSANSQLLRSLGVPAFDCSSHSSCTRCCISHVLYRHDLNVANACVTTNQKQNLLHLRERMKPQASQMMFVVVTHQGWTPSLWRMPGSCADRARVLLLRRNPLLGRK